MKKYDNDWGILDDEHENNPNEMKALIVEINGEKYVMSHQFAGLVHSILLLVDAINDKKV